MKKSPLEFIQERLLMLICSPCKHGNRGECAKCYLETIIKLQVEASIFRAALDEISKHGGAHGEWCTNEANPVPCDACIANKALKGAKDVFQP